ncbi:hypothetical protein AB835_09130 [Candidatus Endobugula sertula]|uniref:Polysaccharide chain length determinant N-terminal domain-containing protein n=1 Tax=Candidatus Endobugula sertula TaxID=62101 RepID=A0A1D2QP87_9GAMM|nr:hypothetical protein AB835_09130 [Candidatus Endobugula sertula]
MIKQFTVPNKHSFPPHNKFDQSIDIIEFIKDLWKEKWSFIITMILSVVLGLAYLYTNKPKYKVSTTLSLPKAVEILELMKTTSDTKGAIRERAFLIYMDTLVSNSHLTAIAQQHNALVQEAFGYNYSKTKDLSPLKKLRVVKINGSSATITISGYSRDAIKKFIEIDLKAAKDIAQQQIIYHYKKELIVFINDTKIVSASQRENLYAQINMLKELTSNERQERLSEIKDRENISEEDSQWIELKKLERMIGDNSYTYYYTNLLTQEKYISTHIREAILKRNLAAIQKVKIDFSFYDPAFNAPTKPYSPEAHRIITASIFIGCLIGFLVAMTRVIVRKRVANAI